MSVSQEVTKHQTCWHNWRQLGSIFWEKRHNIGVFCAYSYNSEFMARRPAVCWNDSLFETWSLPTDWLTDLLIALLTRSLARSLSRWNYHLFNDCLHWHQMNRWFSRSFSRSFSCSLSRSFSYSVSHSFSRSPSRVTDQCSVTGQQNYAWNVLPSRNKLRKIASIFTYQTAIKTISSFQ